MDKQILNDGPNYHRIFRDIILKELPHAKDECLKILSKSVLTSNDVIALNNKIFKKKKKQTDSDQEIRELHRVYDKTSILKILDYQKKEQLNNTQTAIHFSVSRNSIAKWRKIFAV